MQARKTWPKWLLLAQKYTLITLGCALLAFGDAAFISPLGLVTGGVLSIGVIVQHFVTLSGSDFYIVDIITWAVQIIMLVISFIFLGKRFTLRSLFATLLYPALFTLMSRLPIIEGKSLGDYIAQFFMPAKPAEMDWGLYILASLAGGACVGGGVAICYHGGGSTGGLDVISVILARKTPVKEGASALAMDATLVVLGIILIRDVRMGLVGVLSAFACALAVQYLYVNFGAFIIADIVSVKYKDIQKYVHEVMDHATTEVRIIGGYSGEEKTLLRVAFSRRELYSFRDLIGKVDPRAFVTFTQASMINGEGFDPLVSKVFDKNSEGDNGDLHG